MTAPTDDIPDNDAPEPLRGKPARRAQGYEACPPRCLNCRHLVPAVYGRPADNVLGAVPYQHPRCGLGFFIVQLHGVCNEWTGRDGDTLADDSKIVAPAKQQ